MAEAKKVVHLSSVHDATDVRILLKECKSLARAGYSVTLIARAKQDGVVDSVRVKSIRDRGKGRLARMTFSVLDILRQAVGERGALYHFHDPELIPAGLVLRFLGKKVIYDAHEDLPAQILTKAWIPSALRKIIASIAGYTEQLSCRAFNAIIVANPAQAGRFPVSKTVAIQNFPLLSELSSIQTLQYEMRDNNVLYVGGLGAIRGVLEMVRSIHIVNETTTAELRLGGPFSPGSLEMRTSEEPGWMFTRYLGQLDRAQVLRELSHARVGLVVVHPVPNYLTNQPVKMFEYMMAGIPVVASEIENYRQFVEDERAGIMVDPLSPRAIADAILWLLCHPRQAAAMGERGRAAVLSKYNWDMEATKLIGLYRALLPGSAPN